MPHTVSFVEASVYPTNPAAAATGGSKSSRSLKTIVSSVQAEVARVAVPEARAKAAALAEADLAVRVVPLIPKPSSKGATKTVMERSARKKLASVFRRDGRKSTQTRTES